VGVLGTRWTMTGPIYPRAFARAGLDMKTPSKADQEIVDQVIFAELCQGVLRDESRATYLRIIEDLKRTGCDVVALSCTEIPLLVTPDVSPLPTLDSTRLLARAAVDVALGDAPLPAWRGGPFTSR
jgi:aspartate racemase